MVEHLHAEVDLGLAHPVLGQDLVRELGCGQNRDVESAWSRWLLLAVGRRMALLLLTSPNDSPAFEAVFVYSLKGATFVPKAFAVDHDDRARDELLRLFLSPWRSRRPRGAL